jgi:hypothetical protein
MHAGDAPTKLLGLLEVNHADNYLHLGLTVVLLLLGFAKPGAGARM